MTLEQWDDNVKPHLHMIEAASATIVRRVQQLPARPLWPTTAQSEMYRVKETLKLALQRIEAAEAEFEAKPVEA